MSGYDIFDPVKINSGELFAEITPISFNVRIKPGISLAQLRLFFGELQHAEIHGQDICGTCILNSENNDGLLSVNLSPVEIGGLDGAAFEGGQTKDNLTLNLWKVSFFGKAQTLAIF